MSLQQKPDTSITPQQLNDVEISYYSMRLENTYLVSYGDNYEDFVGDVLSRRYPGEFIPVSSGGGDNKNDGIIKSTRELFQCYAPHKYTSAEVNRKIKEDYIGAIEHWGEFFDVWHFAWCHQKSADPDKSTALLILQLERDNGKPIKFFNLANIIDLALSIPRISLVAWLGSAPIVIKELGFDLELREIRKVCEAIVSGESIPDDDIDIRPVPASKLEYNKIPDFIRDYMERGKLLAGRIQYLFSHDSDALLGDKVSQKFFEEYIILKQRQPDNPTGVYWGLFDFIRHRLPNPLDSKLELAAHAILSYLFARCNIFDRPPDDWEAD